MTAKVFNPLALVKNKPIEIAFSYSVIKNPLAINFMLIASYLLVIHYHDIVLPEAMLEALVLEDNSFKQWADFKYTPNVDVYIEKSLLPEMKDKELIIIDAAGGKLPNGDQITL